MKESRILLISFMPRLGNQGLEYVAAMLETAAFEVVTLTVPQATATSQNIKAVLAFIDDRRPTIVGMSLMTPDFKRARDLTEAVKRAFPFIPVLWGGVHPTLAPEDSLRHADMVCVGEGEEATLELANRMENGQDYTEVRNLHVKLNGEVFRNPVRPYAKDLDTLPFPKYPLERWHILETDSVIRPIDVDLFRRYAAYDGTAFTIMTTRGCPYNCAYCCNHSIKRVYEGIADHNHIRRRSVENVMAEMEYIKERFDFLRIFTFSDDSFLLFKDESWLMEFCQEYRRRIGLPFFCKAIPRYVTRERLAMLKEAGLQQIQIGLQANERVNRQVFNRNQSDESFLTAARLLEAARLIRHYDVILHNPYMNEEDLRQTAEILFALKKPYSINYYPLTFFPGTALYQRAIADEIISAESWDEYTWQKSYKELPPSYHYYTRIFHLIPYLPAAILRFFLRHPDNRLFAVLSTVIYSTYFRSIRTAMVLLRRHPAIFFRFIKPLYKLLDKAKKRGKVQ